MNPAGFRHSAVFYARDDAYVRSIVSFVRIGLEREERVLVAVPAHRIGMLREALDLDANYVVFAAIDEFGVNPSRIIPVWRDFLDESIRTGSSCRGVGEPAWPGRPTAAFTECHRHESLLNTAFENGTSWELLCPYDSTKLDEHDLALARATHPYLWEDDATPNTEFDPDSLRRVDETLPKAPPSALELTFTSDSIAVVREAVRTFAEGIELDRGSTDDAVLSAHELASNVVGHGSGSGTLRVWFENGSLVCEVCDRGRILDPLAGRRRPAAESLRGRGLWFVNQVSDLVQLRSSETGTSVRFHIRKACPVVAKNH